MKGGTEYSTQKLDSSTEIIEIGQRQDPKMDSLENGFSSSEVTHQSVNERTQQATEPILRPVGKMRAPLASQNELKTTGTAKLPV